ncbi:uncharacterized protein LOC135221871 isoform X2 [Macrobrachium nipponense]|uniref:uncharacterized protein LOC135221871 isoform X2 n=1 Tax=Macrobrachium nipponense TaxID=159736 RepID=UPI0030C85357
MYNICTIMIMKTILRQRSLYLPDGTIEFFLFNDWFAVRFPMLQRLVHVSAVKTDELKGVACRTRWSNLRDQFRRANKTKRTLNGEASEKKKWKFDKEMAFLKPYYHERSSVPNNSSDTDELLEASKEGGGGGGGDDDTDDAEKDSTYSPGPASRKKKRVVETKDQDKITKASAELDQQQDETTPVRMEEDITQSSSRPKSRPTHNQTIQRVQPIFKGPYYLQRGHGPERERNQEVKRSTDHIDAFLFGIAETVKLFPPVFQHMAKNKIFNAVSELEMELLLKSQVLSNLSDKGDKM